MTPEPRPGLRLVATMGTVVTLDVRTVLPPSRSQAALDDAEALLRGADEMLSTYRADSWVSRLARGEVALADVPAPVTEVLALCERAEDMTQGLFTARWRGDGALDPTGLVKGWAAGRAGRLLRARGAADHCVNAAGDVALSGRPAVGRDWRVAISDPAQPGAVLGVVDPAAVPGARHGDGPRTWSVATSGTAEQGLHVLDPRTGRPAAALLSATVVGPDAGLADGLATGLLAAGPDAASLLERWRPVGWRGLLVHGDGSVWDPDRLLTPSPIVASR